MQIDRLDFLPHLTPMIYGMGWQGEWIQPNMMRTYYNCSRLALFGLDESIKPTQNEGMSATANRRQILLDMYYNDEEQVIYFCRNKY